MSDGNDVSHWDPVGYITEADLLPEGFASVGQLVESFKAANKSMVISIAKVKPSTLRLLYGAAPERCDYSWLWPEQCAHCLGHTLPDDVPVQS